MSNTPTAVTNTQSSGRRRWNATDLGLIAVFAALVAGAGR
jgi:biotin transport system substrate-specific component